MKTTVLLFFSLFFFSGIQSVCAQNISGKVRFAGTPVSGASVRIGNTPLYTVTDAEGYFKIGPVDDGSYTLRVHQLGMALSSQTVMLKGGKHGSLVFDLRESDEELNEVQVFGKSNAIPEKLETLTRLPLAPSEQIQSISIISDKLVQQQGALSVIEGVRNVPGVYTYATFGGVRESISSRGFRGIPVLKNGVRVMTDFRGPGFSTDMQGVENIQVLKGASSITMGAATDLGGPGGIVNIVTKTPHFQEQGEASMRVGSWGLIRPTVDVQGLVNKDQTVAYRFNMAYENGGKFRDHMSKESIYLNPSVAWRPDNRTSLVVEADYFNDNQSIDAGTVNLSPKNESNQIYDLPTNRFLGFESDISSTKSTTYSAQFKRQLSHKLSFRTAFVASNYDADDIRTSLTPLKSSEENPDLNQEQRNWYLRSLTKARPRTDKSRVFQADLVGEKLKLGKTKHTFIAGFDYRKVNTVVPTYSALAIDTINVFEPSSIVNELPAGSAPTFGNPTKIENTEDNVFGFTLQDVVQLTDWVRAYGGIRFSSNQSALQGGTAVTRSTAWNPLAGLMVSIKPGLNLFGSYTNSTNPRTASKLDSEGKVLGSERIDQFETGIKSEWLNDRLRFNLTLYKIYNRDMNMEVFDENGVTLNYFEKGGNDERKGIETELSGSILPNLEVILGYAFIDAQYKEHNTFIRGSAPNNTPKHTFNAYVHYTLQNGKAKGLDLGAGVYYIGERPYNDWTKPGANFHNIEPGQAPWNNKAYLITNVQVGYAFNNKYSLRLLANNVLDALGYDAYRDQYIDRIKPRNFSAMFNYKF